MRLLWISSFLIFAISCQNKMQDEESGSTGNSWALLPFEKLDSINPILKPGINSFYCPIEQKEVSWEIKNVFNPAGVVRNDTLYLLYRAQDSVGQADGTSRIGLAWSTDGIHFTRYERPVLYPDNDAWKKYEWPGGCEDPRIVEDENGVYFMTYTAYDGQTARLCMATSTDLFNWKKQGLVFKGKYEDTWSKSGAIISNFKEGKIVAEKVNGKYWMYWGDKYIWSATSSDLINWQPVETPETDNNYDSIYAGSDISKLEIALPTRSGKFDCNIVEPGPPAMITEKGILLLYNGRNLKDCGDTTLADGTYSASQVLFDKNDPSKIIERMDGYFLTPEKAYEIVGQVNNVCFIESLLYYKNKWWLYYGTADSRIAVAIKE